MAATLADYYSNGGTYNVGSTYTKDLTSGWGWRQYKNAYEHATGKGSFYQEKADQALRNMPEIEAMSAAELKEFLRASGFDLNHKEGAIGDLPLGQLQQAAALMLGAVPYSNRGFYTKNKSNRHPKDELAAFSRYNAGVKKLLDAGITVDQAKKLMARAKSDGHFDSPEAWEKFEGQYLKGDTLDLTDGDLNNWAAAAGLETLGEEADTTGTPTSVTVTPTEERPPDAEDTAEQIIDDAVVPIGENVTEDVGQTNETQDAAVDAAGDVSDSADGARDLETYYTGGNVTEGLAAQLGYTKNQTTNEDGETVTTYNKDGQTYTVNEAGELVRQDTGDVASYGGQLNAPENDFGGRTNDVLDAFLYGDKVTAENAGEHGYYQVSGEWFDRDGNSVQVGDNGDFLDANGNPTRSMGFNDYQHDLQESAKTYKSEMSGLRDKYEQTYEQYSLQLRPRLGKLDANTAALGKVAADANDPSYFGKLSDLYFAGQSDRINADAVGARDTLDSTFANAGMDANSPAYVKAMMDINKQRGESMRNAKRQSMLDSYSLGNQMLSNRQSALQAQQSGITSGMNALGSLYSVKLSGLDADKDMITTVFEGDQNIAKIGIGGLNTVADTQLKGVNADRDQFKWDMDIRTGLNKNTLDASVIDAGTNTDVSNTVQNQNMTNLNWLGTYLSDNLDQDMLGPSLMMAFKQAKMNPADYFDYDTMQKLKLSPITNFDD